MDMNLENIPFIGKYKAYFAAAGLILAGLAGFLNAVASMVLETAHLFMLQEGIFQYASNMETDVGLALPFLAGMGILGIRHGQQKAQAATVAAIAAIPAPVVINNSQTADAAAAGI